MTDQDVADIVKGLKAGAHEVVIRPLSYAGSVGSYAAAAAGSRDRAAQHAAGERVVQVVIGGKVTKRWSATEPQLDILRKAGAKERDEPDGQEDDD